MHQPGAQGVNGAGVRHLNPSSIVDPAAATQAVDPFERIPAELRALPQWCMAAWDKSPMCVVADGSSRHASPTDPSTWTDFETAQRCAAERKLGIGFVLTKDDPFSIVDIDIKADTSDAEFVRRSNIAGSFHSYTERSRNGRGFHVVVRGKIGKGRRDNGGIEVYSQDRFMIFTGDHVPESPKTIEHRQPNLDALVSTMPAANEGELLIEGPQVASDEAVITQAASPKFDDLFAGRWEEHNYPSQSEADAALMAIIATHTRSNAQAKRIFLTSALGQRSKAARKDYLDDTLKFIRSREAGETKLASGVKTDLDAMRANDAKRKAAIAIAPSPKTRSRGESGAELMVRPMRAISYLSDPWLAEGLIVVAGRPKLGKTTLARQMMAAVSAGSEFFGERCQQASALFLCLEEGDRLNKHKLELAAYSHEELSNIYIEYEWQRGRAGAQALGEYLAQYTDVRFVVIDSLTKFRDPETGKVPAFQADYSAVDVLHEISKQFAGVVIVVIHHTRKMKSDDPIDEISGTYGLTGACDTYMVMRHHALGATLHVGGRIWSRDQAEFGLTRRNQRWHLQSAFDGLRSSQVDALAIIKQHVAGITPTELARELGIAPSSAHERLQSLANAGKVMSANGRYAAKRE